MTTTMHLPETFDNMAAELSDRAFRVVSRHGIRGNSVDLELKMWEALRRELKRSSQCPGHLKGTVAQSHTDTCLAVLTDRAYQVALEQGFDGFFVDLQLDLWNDFRSLTGRTQNEGTTH
jgi:hypothetical protein